MDAAQDQDAPSRYRVGCAAGRRALPRERFNPLTQGGSRPGRAAGPVTGALRPSHGGKNVNKSLQRAHS